MASQIPDSIPSSFSSPRVPQQPFAVPDAVSNSLPRVDSIRVPDVVTGTNLAEVPDWTYKKFSPFDVFHSKIGIAATTSLFSFAILSYMNPPFVQESGDNKIEIRKCSASKVYVISLCVFLFILLVPVNPMPSVSR